MTYVKLTDLSFPTALTEAINNGAVVTRRGWSKNFHVVVLSEETNKDIKIDHPSCKWTNDFKEYLRSTGYKHKGLPTLALISDDYSTTYNWQPNQSDIFSLDWYVMSYMTLVK